MLKLMKMEMLTLTSWAKRIDFIVEKAVEYNLGAIRFEINLWQAIISDAMYELPSDDFY